MYLRPEKVDLIQRHVCLYLYIGSDCRGPLLPANDWPPPEHLWWFGYCKRRINTIT